MALDPRQGAVRILVAERLVDQFRIRERITIPRELDFSGEIVRETIRKLRSEYDPLRLHVLLPQSESVSQRIVLGHGTIEGFVASESERFEKIEGTAPLFDYRPLEGQDGSGWWLTWCSKTSVEQHLESLGLEGVDDVNSMVDGLMGLFHATQDCPESLHVADIDPHQTTVLHVVGGEPRSTSTFPTPPQLETPPLDQPVDLWWERFLKQAAPRPSGQEGCLLLAGEEKRIERLSERPGWRIRKFEPPSGDDAHPEFATVTQVAHAVLAWPERCISLAPGSCRAQQRQSRLWARLRGMTSLACLLSLLVLLGGTWYQTALNQRNHDLLAGLERDLAQRQEEEKKVQSLESHYRRIRPLLHHHRHTRKLLQTIESIRSQTAGHEAWVSLLADYQTYFTWVDPGSPEPQDAPADYLERYPGPGFVLELGFSGKESTVVANSTVRLTEQLNQDPSLFQADLLPEVYQRQLVSTNLILPGRQRTISLQLAPNPFSAPGDPSTAPRPSPPPAPGGEAAVRDSAPSRS